MALVLTGDLGRATKGDVLAYLAANPPSDTLPNYAGNLGRYVMGVVAAGGNPYDLSGTNYVNLLKTAAREEGHNWNFFAEAYVPLGLAAAGDPGCFEAQDSIAYLKDRQGPGGNWVGVDATGLVICAMIACGEDPASEPVQRAMTWLRDNQNDDGGFPADPGGASNSNSENLAIMAICTVGDDPMTWVKNGATPIDHLLSCQQPNGQIWWKPDAEGWFPIQCTAFGAIALSEGWLPTATFGGQIPQPKIEVNKTANVTEAVAVGDIIGYTILVNNTGNVNLDNVLAYDNLTAHIEEIGTLAPGEGYRFNTTYVVTESDLCKPIVNNATANGTDPGDIIIENFSIETVETSLHSAIEVNKTANVTEATTGDVIGYTILVNNTGDTNLTNVLACDNLTDHLELIGDLMPGQSYRFNTTYVVTESDLNTTIVNNATANGTDPCGTIVANFDTESVEAVPFEQVPVRLMVWNNGTLVFDASFDVTAIDPTAWDAIRQSGVDYTYTEYGWGVSIDTIAGITEPGFYINGEMSAVGVADYYVNDNDHLQFVGPNDWASGTSASVLYLAEVPEVVNAGDNFRIKVMEKPANGFSWVPINSSGAAVHVDGIEYLTGADGWTDDISIDHDVSVHATKPDCLASYWLDGYAHIHVRNPAIEVNKTANVTRVTAGDVIGYTILVNNTGDTNLDNVLAYDNLTDHLEPIGTLAPGENHRFNTTYVVTEDDLNTTIVNNATANGTDPDGTLIENFSIETVEAVVPEVVPVRLMVWDNGALVYNDTVDATAIDPTAWDAIRQSGVDYTYTDYGWGIVIDTIAGITEPGFYVNGEMSMVGVAGYYVNDNDHLQFVGPNDWASGSSASILYLEDPPAAVAKFENFRIKVMEKPANGFSWDPVPSSGATVTVGGIKCLTGADGLTRNLTLDKDAVYCLYATKSSCLATYWLDGISTIESGTGGPFICDLGEDTFDFGDAPDPTYPTLLASNGARHVIDGITYLGSSIDAEDDGQPDPNALGDDNDGNDDEEGVIFTNDLVPGGIGSIEVTATTPGKLDAWIDFNRNGDWADNGEQIFAGEDLPAGTSYHGFPVPIDAVPDDDGSLTFARFRFSTAGGLAFTGPASDGEVEDHTVTILNDTDGDGVSDIIEGRYEPSPPDRDDDGIPDWEEYDPSGYFYDETTGEIIPGGRIGVESSAGPGHVTITHDGSSGFYEFWTDGTPGTYIMVLTFPPGHALSADCLPRPGSFDPTNGPDPTYLGSGEFGTTGYLASCDCQDNPYYLSFDLEPQDPFVMTNNIPLSNQTAVANLNVTKTALDKKVNRGDETSYIIEICNPSTAPVYNVVVRDVFDRTVEFVSASPMPDDDGIWHFDVIPANTCVNIDLTVKIPKQDLDFGMDQGVSGEGFVNVANDYSTTLLPYAIINRVYVTSDETPEISTTESVTVLGDPGTELSTREHGSGTYESEEQVRMLTENKSISMDKDVSAKYGPTSLGLYRNRTVEYSSRWTEEARAKNRMTGSTMHEQYRHATTIDRESRIDLDKNGSTMEFDSEFEGMGHVGVLKTSGPHATPGVEFREDYTGSFRVYEKIDEYGSGVTVDKSASGTGFVAADKRVKDSQRSYESGTGTYDSEEIIRTSSNYIAKDISLIHRPSSFKIDGETWSNQSLKWKEGMWSKNPKTSFIGEEYTDIDRLKKETTAKGLNRMDTEAEFSGRARYRTVLRDEVDLDEDYIGDYSIKQRILFHGIPKYDHPHLAVNKSGDLHYEDDEDETVLARYNITVENDGNRALGPIYVKDLFPPGAGYINASMRPSELTSTSANWTLTHLAIGDQLAIELWLNVTEYAGDELVNRIEASGGYNDRWVTATNFTAIEIDWLSCCLERTISVTKTAQIDQNATNVVKYTLTIQNLEDSTRVARVVDPLPEGMKLLDASIPPTTDDDGVLTWNLIDLKPFETKTIVYETEASWSGTFVNRAEVNLRSVNGTSLPTQYGCAVIDVGTFDKQKSAPGWQPPDWGFNLTCEETCDLMD